MYKRNAALAVVLASLLAAGCGSTGGAGDFNLISIEEEWQLGNQLSQDVEKQAKFVFFLMAAYSILPVLYCRKLTGKYELECEDASCFEGWHRV